MEEKIKHFSGFRKFVSNKLNVTYIVFIAIAITGAVVIYFIQGLSTQKSLAEQMLHREQTIVRAGAISLDDFLKDVGKDLSSVSTGDEFKTGNSSLIRQYLKEYERQQMGTPIVAIVLADKDGNVIEDVSLSGTPDLGANISERDYFQFTKQMKSGDYYISDPVVSKLGYTKNQFIIPIAVPVFDKNNNFNGSLLSVVSLSELIEKYVDPLKISSKTDIYMLDMNAKMLFSTTTEYVGRNLTDIANNLEFKGKDKLLKVFADEFAKPSVEGKLDVYIPNISQDGKTVRSLITYAPVYSGINSTNDWYLVISTPASEAFFFTGIFYTDQLFALIYSILTILILSTLGFTSGKLHRRENG